MILKIKIFKNIDYQKLLLFIFFLTPTIIFFSKFISDLFISLIALSSIYFIINLKRYKDLKLISFFLIFILYVCINSVIQEQDVKLFFKSFFLVRFPLFILFPFLINFKINDLNFNYKFLFLFPLFIFLFNFYFQVFFNQDIFGNNLSNNYERVTSFFNDEYIAGSYLFFIFAIIILVTDKIKTPILFLLVLIYLAIFFSGDRTPFISINLFLTVICLANIKKIIFSQKFIIMIFFMPIIFFLLIFMHSKQLISIAAFDKYKGTYINIIKDIEQNETNRNLGLKRWPYYGLYSKSFVIFKNNIFFGTTYKTFRTECGKTEYDEDYKNLTDGLEYNGCSTHPHNIYLEILSEQGLIGFILLCFLIYNLFRLSSNIISYNLLNYKIFLIVYFFPFKPFGSFYTNFGLIMLSSTIAYFIIFNKKNLN
jgi:O-antigen ligase